MNAVSMILVFVIIFGVALFNNKLSSLKSANKQKDARIKILEYELGRLEKKK